MLLTKGVIRIGLPVPENAEFVLSEAADPYGYAGNNANGNELSLFRRPLPTTNLTFLSTIMWDGRETLQKGSAAAINFDLAHQSNSATESHAQAPTPLDQATRELIVAYQLGLFTAQVSDAGAGGLRKDGATAGRKSWRNGSSSSATTTRWAATRRARTAPGRTRCSTPSCSPSSTRGRILRAAAGTGRAGPSRGARSSSIRCRFRSRASRGSTTISTWRP